MIDICWPASHKCWLIDWLVFNSTSIHNGQFVSQSAGEGNQLRRPRMVNNRQCTIPFTLHNNNVTQFAVKQLHKRNKFLASQTSLSMIELRRHNKHTKLKLKKMISLPSGFIPWSIHFLYRHAWHAFRLFLFISHCPLAGHTYSMRPVQTR